MKNNQILITVLIAVIVGAAAFFGGMQYQKSQTRNQLASRFGSGQFGQNGGQGGRRFGGPNGMGGVVRGQIISSDEKSITVKLPDGSSKIVLVNDNTSITEATSANKQALTTGQQVLVFGSQNSDGSVTAQNVQLNPQMGRMGGFNSPSPSSK